MVMNCALISQKNQEKIVKTKRVFTMIWRKIRVLPGWMPFCWRPQDSLPPRFRQWDAAHSHTTPFWKHLRVSSRIHAWKKNHQIIRQIESS